MRRKISPSPEEEDSQEPLINLTPLIDVVFVVLIAFMLIAPILEIDSIDLALGGASNSKDASTSSLSITVRADNSIWFQGKHVTLDELEKLLKIEKNRRPKEIPQIAPDKKAHFGTYQSVKNALEICGFEQMEVILQPP